VGIDIKQSQITLQKANQAALDLERLLKEQESLISGTKAAASVQGLERRDSQPLGI
jgi:hypothetical protein